jgi:hypothetical protein
MGKRVAALILLAAGCAGRGDRMIRIDEETIGRDAEAWRERMRRRAELVREADAPALLGRLDGAAPWARAFLLDALAWIGDPRALDAAVRASRRGEPRHVRSAAIRLLGRIGAKPRLREILAEPLERVSPYETTTDWIHVQAEHALALPPRKPEWDPSAWETARVGAPAPCFRLERTTVLLFLLADW